jgi:Flp pilus assembly protein TadD
MTQIPADAGRYESLESALRRARELLGSGRFTEAEGVCRQALRVWSEQPPLLQLLGIIAQQSGDIGRAIEWVERATKISGAQPDSDAQLADLYRLSGRLDDALTAGRRAVQRPSPGPRALFALGMVHVERRELDEATSCFLRALALSADFASAHLELGHVLLLKGEFRAGWLEYEWRYRLETTRDTLPRFPTPQWNGMRLPRGRILLIGDQGFGDTIQFARFVPEVAERCSELLIGCSEQLLPLLATLPGAHRCFARWEQIPRFDMHSTFSSLPGILGVDLASIPASCPYLQLDAARVERWADRLASCVGGDKLRVGISWAGRPSHPNDHRRSAKWADLAPLARLPGVTAVALQKEVPAADRARFAADGVADVSTALTDFMETAAAIVNLDLVVTVDTSVAHLAGALGKAVWILLPWLPDWRWLLDREDCPWYPTARLFRQRKRGEWGWVVERVIEELRAVVGGDRARLAPFADRSRR